MTTWQQNLANQKCVEQIQGCLSVLTSINTEGFAAEHLAIFARLLKVLKALEARISTIDAELFPAGTWGSFGGWLSSARIHLQQFAQTKNPTLLQQANDNVDNILGVLKPLDAQASSEAIKAMGEAAAAFQAKIIEELERVRTKSAEIKVQVESLGKDITQGKARLDENNKVIEQQKGRLDQSIADFQKQFSEAQEKRTKEFADAIKRNSDELSKQGKVFETQFTETTCRRKEEYDKFFEDARKQSNAHLDFLQKREEEVNKIFGAIGATAFAGNFKATADDEAKAANLWRWIALGLMAAMIVIGGYAFYYSIGHETDWRVFAFRLGTVIVFAVPAVYAANESSKHRERERLNRKVHLELASIDAYLVLLPESERNKIKGNLAEKFFGVPVLKENGEEVTRKDLLGVLTTAVDNLTKGK